MANLLVLYTDLDKGNCVTCGAGTDQKNVVEHYTARILGARTQKLDMGGCSK